jgi:SAM-dependent methyltransferase
MSHHAEVAGDREHLRRTFDSAADLYERARPDYPADLYGELLRLTNLRRDDRLLEVGCATGKATAPLARLGFRITCIEVGDELAKAARRNLEPFPAVKVIHAAFEDWTPGPAEQFDLVFAATAWHWIDPKIRYGKAAELLRPGGHLAFWSATHVFPEGGDPFFQEIQEVYDEIGEGVPPGTRWPRPGELPDSRGEIEASGFFEDVVLRHFDWEVVYNADEYLALLDTFSGHIAMASWQRDRLYAEIRRRLGQRPDGRLRRHWGTVLHVARLRESPLSGVI